MPNGVHLILSRDDAKSVFGSREPETLLETISTLLTAASEKTRYASGPEWHLAHQVLARVAAKKSAADEHQGSTLSQCYLGGRRLLDNSDQLVVLVRPDLVPHVAAELSEISREMLAEAVSEETAGRDTLESLGETLAGLRQLFQDAADRRSAVLFTTVSSI